MVHDAVSGAVTGKEWQCWHNQELIGCSGSSDTRCRSNWGGGDNHRQVICGWRIRKGPRLLISLRKKRKSLPWPKGPTGSGLYPLTSPTQAPRCPPPCCATHPCTLPRAFHLLSPEGSSFPSFTWITCTEKILWAHPLFHFLVPTSFQYLFLFCVLPLR